MRRFFWDLSDLSAERRPGRFGSLLLAACAWAWAFSLAWAHKGAYEKRSLSCTPFNCSTSYRCNNKNGHLLTYGQILWALQRACGGSGHFARCKALKVRSFFAKHI
eukprot:1146324-Pelagomonas_calceolata.AAC.1